MSKKKVHKISKSKLVKLNEDNLMFITNPGRMGDEDGLTFIIKENDKFIIYRVDGLMYQRGDIVLNDIKKQFPKWAHTWKHFKEKEYKGKYKYLYMGFGNGLCIDNTIYDEFKPYLDEKVKAYLDSHNGDKSLEYAAIFDTWESALEEYLSRRN
jgi:hypothetical protein